MNPRRLVLSLVVLLAGAATLTASGPLGIYGIVEKVVFEPNEQAPECIQVWGAFAYVDGIGAQSLTVSSAKRGYLYFRLHGATNETEQSIKLARNEWNDLKSVAGTGQAVGFGRWGYIGGFGTLQPDAAGRPPNIMYEHAPGNPRTDYVYDRHRKLQPPLRFIKQIQEW